MKWKYYKPKFESDSVINPLESGWWGHVFFAYDLVANTKPKTIVELGTHKGHSFFAFCQGIKDQNIDAKIVAVDTWQGDEHAGFYGDEIFDEVDNVVNHYYEKIKIQLIRKTFDEALDDFAEKSIDILHIDGLHTYEAVKRDFEKWLPKVKEDGVILFHDIVVKERDFGVYKLWDDIKRDYYTMEFYHSNGLGVIIKKDSKLFDLFKNQDLWRAYYDSMSNNKILKIDLNKEKKEIKQKNREIQQKEQEIILIKSSKFWKLRNLYCSWKKKLRN